MTFCIVGPLPSRGDAGVATSSKALAACSK